MGWLEGIEPSPTGPQPAVLPLNYSHHVSILKLKIKISKFWNPASREFFIRAQPRRGGATPSSGIRQLADLSTYKGSGAVFLN